MIRGKGFTIVELLIVIVVIAILAAITVIAFNGIQERARTAKIAGDIKAVHGMILNYYAENGHYPITQTRTPITGYVPSRQQADVTIQGLKLPD